MKTKDIIYIIFAVIISIITTYYLNYKNFKDEGSPVLAYRVYLEGKSIGLIDSDKKLEDYINKEQELLKKKYDVKKIYIPNDLDIVKEMTFDNNLTKVNTIYEKIKDVKPFTIRGYEVTIPKIDINDHSLDGYIGETNTNEKDGTETITFYVLDKQMLINTLEKLVKIFVGEDGYNKFINDSQTEIKDSGSIIEDVYLEKEEKMSIKLKNISVDKEIILTEEVLSKFLLFGTTREQQKYFVKANDTIPDIAEKNKMSTEEFLIANPNFKDVNTLLYEGEEVTLGILNPLVSVVEESHVVKEESIGYKTEYQYDNTQMTGYSKVVQAGSNGINKVTQKIKKVNGEIVNALITENEELKPVVNEIVVKGGRQPVIVGSGNWAWPTNVPYILSSRYGWRWGKLHSGIDICGTGFGSPIYAARAGTITTSEYGPSTGYYVAIDHGDGYYTQYLHLASISKYVKVGDRVKMGQVIGDMGNSGHSFGTHLHFEIWRGVPYTSGGQTYNPLLFY